MRLSIKATVLATIGLCFAPALVLGGLAFLVTGVIVGAPADAFVIGVAGTSSLCGAIIVAFGLRTSRSHQAGRSRAFLGPRAGKILLWGLPLAMVFAIAGVQAQRDMTRAAARDLCERAISPDANAAAQAACITRAHACFTAGGSDAQLACLRASLAH